MITRRISSATQPVCYPSGATISTMLYWTLVDEDNQVAYGIDTTTEERVVHYRVPSTCTDGVFTVSLWPTDRDIYSRGLRYRCEIPEFRVVLVYPFYDLGGDYTTTFAEWTGLTFPTDAIITEDGIDIMTEDGLTMCVEVE